MTADYAFVTGGIAAETEVFTLTRHGYDSGMMLANGTWFDSLSDTNKMAFRSAYGDPVDFRKRSRVYSSAALARLSAESVTQVVELTAEQRARWVSLTRWTHAALLDRIGSPAVELYTLIEEAKARF